MCFPGMQDTFCIAQSVKFCTCAKGRNRDRTGGKDISVRNACFDRCVARPFCRNIAIRINRGNLGIAALPLYRLIAGVGELHGCTDIIGGFLPDFNLGSIRRDRRPRASQSYSTVLSPFGRAAGEPFQFLGAKKPCRTRQS